MNHADIFFQNIQESSRPSQIVSLPSKDHWDDLNSAVKQKYFPELINQIRCYCSEHQALMEVLIGTQNFLSHKKGAAIVFGSNPFIEALSPIWIREQVQLLSWTQADFPQSLDEAKKKVSELPAHIAYVFFCEDHPITGDIFSWEFLDQALNEKRIFSIRLSHHSHFQNLPQKEQNLVRAFSTRIRVYDSTHVIAELGARFKTPPVGAAWSPWRELSLTWNDPNLYQRVINPSLVEVFEDELKEFRFFSHPKAFGTRVYDRALLVFRGMNSKMWHNIFHSCSFLSESDKTLILGMSACEWGCFKSMSWWQEAPSDDILRDLLILPAKVLEQKQLVNFLRSEYQKVIQEQSWKIP